MIVFMMIALAIAEVLELDLAKKIENLNGQVLELSDQEGKNIVYSGYFDAFILFYNSEDFSTKKLLNDWSKASLKLHSNGVNITMGSLDVAYGKKLYKKLLIKNFPCACYFRPWKFNQYFGPFDEDSIYELVTTKSYLQLPTYSSPYSLTSAEYVSKLFYQGIEGQWVIVINIGLVALIFTGFIIYACISSMIRKEKIQ
ncbi:hypothetical protein SteCoe_23042 [Stentor coeruleus]|uniref:Thioredoxin domain-containing protein n=1 Tax=Stentor coeruleus TaxID=5963 RepID=A0A1R2BKZ1_9CILI|nr:hypothetical protein SteCoe_23042 [Stentor coeruleus]